MANNEEQNSIEKAKETKQAIQEGAKLAKNAASGNVIGAAKNALKLLKNKKIKKMIIRKLILAVTIILIILMLGLSFFGIINAIKDGMIGLLSNAGTAISGFFSDAWQLLTNDYWIKLDEKVEYIIDADTGQTLGTSSTIKDEDLKDKNGNPKNTITESYTIVDKYIKELGSKGISLKELRLLGDADYSDEENILKDEENKALVEKYIAEFIRADIITQQPHKNKTPALVHPINQNLVDGGVYLYRTKNEPIINEKDFENGNYNEENIEVTDKNYVQMEFMEYDEFFERLGKNDEKLRYRFTIDKATDELIFVEIKTVTRAKDQIPVESGWFQDIVAWINEQIVEKTDYELKPIRIPYKEYIAKYTMPYEFLVNLCQITQNPEFVYHVALLARNTKIILAVQDNVTITRETEEVMNEYTSYRNNSGPSVDSAFKTNTRKERVRTVITTTTQTPVLRVEYADTWSFYDEFDFTKNVTGELEESEPNVVEYHPSGDILSHVESYTYTPSNPSDPHYQGAGTTVTIPEYWQGTFTTKTETNTQVITTTTTYNEPIIKKSVQKSKQFLGLLRNDNGKCEHNCYKKDAWEIEIPVAYYCAKEAEFDRNGINVEYRIPNMTKKEAPFNKLLSGLDMLYAVLQSNSSGYEEDKIISNEQIGESYEIQDQYIADEDYESAYIVKMQGLAEHIRYLMTFPENESYTIKDLILDNIFGDDENNNFNDIVIPPGVTADVAQIYDFLIGKGFTPESACAILGNMQQESGFNTAATNGTHYGLCQWGGGRFEGLKNFAQNKGTEWTDLETQLEYLWYELCESKISVKNEIINSTDMEYATDVFCRKFEVCGNYGIEVPKRYRYAQYWYNIFVQGNSNTNLTPTQDNLLKVINNLSSYSGIQNDGGYCQRFVRTVFEQIGVSGNASSASDAEQKWKVSSDINNIPIGATVYGKGSSSDGHVGIYIGNGMVVHNTGNSNCSYSGMIGIKCEDINSWNRKYEFTSWGWQGGVNLSI